MTNHQREGFHLLKQLIEYLNDINLLTCYRVGYQREKKEGGYVDEKVMSHNTINPQTIDKFKRHESIDESKATKCHKNKHFS